MATKSISHEKGSFLTDVKEIRRRARQQIMEGAVTSDYRGDRETVVRVLNHALATEIVCVLRYKRHHYMAKGIHSQAGTTHTQSQFRTDNHLGDSELRTLKGELYSSFVIW